MSSVSQSTNMLHTPVVLLFFRYSVPWTLSFLLLSSAGVVDGYFVGRYVGSLALASINIIWPIYSFIMGIGVALASGGGVRCAAYLGTGNDEAAKAVYTKVMLCGFLFSLAFSIPLFFYASEVARLLGADETLLPYCVEYLEIASFFMPPLMVGFVWTYFLRVDERPTLASTGMACTAIVNIVLDYIFIAHFSMGVKGSALATGIAYTFALVLYIRGYLYSKKPRRLSFTKAVGSWLEIFQSIWNGISEMINEMSSGFVLILINITVIKLIGPYGVAAFTVISYLNWLCLMLCYGFSDSLSPLVSANHACQLHRRTQSLLICGMSITFSIGFLCFLAMTFYPMELITIFVSDNEDTIDLALNFMNICRFMFLFCGANIIISAYFTGLLKAGASALVAILRTLILPVLFIWLLPQFMQYQGVALALPLSEGLTLIVAIYLLLKLQPVDTKHKKQ